jgi:hypothetical protein
MVATRSVWLVGKNFQACAFQVENDPVPAKATTAEAIAKTIAAKTIGIETNLLRIGSIWCISPFLMDREVQL